MNRLMKVIVLGGLSLGMFAVAIGGIPEIGLPTIKRYAGHQPAGYGYLYTHSWANGTDTAWVCDTSSVMAIGGAQRASITYWSGYYDNTGGFCGGSLNNTDSASYKLIYQWSNDLVNWMATDSVSKTDTLYHNDTLIVRPFEYMWIIARLPRPTKTAWDTAGLGGGASDVAPWGVTNYRVQVFFPGEVK